MSPAFIDNLPFDVLVVFAAGLVALIQWLLRKGERLTLRYQLSNLGPAGETKGAGALVYFVPVQGN